MEQSAHTHPPDLAGWYRAIPLRERAAALPAGGESNEGFDLELAQRRLARWRQTLSPCEDRLETRLNEIGISEQGLARLLAEPAEALARRSHTPTWLATLLEAYSVRGGPKLRESLASTGDGDRDALLSPFLPLVAHARRRLRRGMEDLLRRDPQAPFEPRSTEEMLAAALPRQLLSLVSRTMTLELHVARLEERLTGDTPQARFRSFTDRLLEPAAALDLLAEYPVLAHQLVVQLEQWTANQLEFLERLAADAVTLREVFGARSDSGNRDLGLLTAVQIGAGDRHRDGRTVQIATFSSGLRVVYKPRSVAVEERFQELLTWLGPVEGLPLSRPVEVIDGGEYGWVEWIEARACDSPGEVRRFYWRLGGFLALLYSLEATDFHQENLIAAGEFPVLVDLETLFHPRFEDPAQVSDPGSAHLDHSVFRVGLLPQRVRFQDGGAGVDLSGLGGEAGQPLPSLYAVLADVGSDEMRVERQHLELPDSHHRPRIEGHAADPLEHRQPLIAGFTAVYRTLVARRRALLAEDGPLARFADVETRVILRPTMIYGRLLLESSHPTLLRNALDRDRFFDRLRASPDTAPHLSAAIAAEQAQLWRGDVPCFTTQPGSIEVVANTGERLAWKPAASGLSLAQQRITRLGEDDLRRQSALIKSALTTLTMGRRAGELLRYRLPESAPPVTRERLRTIAGDLGQRLANLAIEGDDGAVTWIGIDHVSELEMAVQPVGQDLYSGLTGVALFLGHLGAALDEDRYTQLARRALDTVLRRLDRTPELRHPIGGFLGWGGLLYATSQLATLWRDHDLLSAAEGRLVDVKAAIETNEESDLISGLAGCAAGLLVFHRTTGSAAALAAAIDCGKRIEAMAQPQANGLCWPKGDPGTPLAGLSHGAAGIAWALLRLNAASGRSSFRRTALDALAYERSLFCPQRGNWRDLREPVAGAEDYDSYSSLGWCHGAPGIGLARIGGLDQLDDEEVRGEIAAAVEITREHGFGRNHSLCHGDLGNLELLVQARRRLGAEHLGPQIERLTAALVAGGEQTGWVCGTPGGVESPGLMTGLAGIGYGLLRLADPERVPSVLLLEPPTGVAPVAEEE